jgi:hypothetical protein
VLCVQIAAGSVLIAIVALVFLPCIRLWRSIGYDRGPGVLVTLASLIGVVAYELATRFYFVDIIVKRGDHFWSARVISQGLELAVASYLALDMYRYATLIFFTHTHTHILLSGSSEVSLHTKLHQLWHVFQVLPRPHSLSSACHHHRPHCRGVCVHGN